MDEMEKLEPNEKKPLILGILAHVDAGKTTLTEALLYAAGKIARMGRVDNRDVYLDTFELERARGITIFSKQAVFDVGDVRVTLLDTPGHVDFSAEMERALQALDYAILVVSGASSVQGHTRTLWQLFERYHVPVFLFVNKMDQRGTDRGHLLDELKRLLGDGCIPFDREPDPAFFEQLALCDESLLETFLASGTVPRAQIRDAIADRKVFPCWFGSALRMEGVEAFLEGLADLVVFPEYPEAFGARVFKITRDEQGNRLTHLKVTGGVMKIRMPVDNHGEAEKITGIRLYSGTRFEALPEIGAGSVCAVTGLTRTRAGDGLGFEAAADPPVLEPVLSYRLLLPEDCDPKRFLPQLRQLEEEEPELHLAWDEVSQEIHVRLMGEVQMEILASLVKSRFGVDIGFDAGQVLYRETIASTVEGVGHFEPLRHYAEVHLLLEPGDAGSGLLFDSRCSEDELGRSWQHLVLSHLEERVHRGVLTGAELTDVRITLLSGKAHSKHTQGGDFREATFRAVRQGLMEAEPVLLEPYYRYQLVVPERVVGRAMGDIEAMRGTCRVEKHDGELVWLQGMAPVAAMKNYQQAVAAYTKGLGRLFCRMQGYAPCHDTEAVTRARGYDPTLDAGQPPDSVFCAQGSVFVVPWHEVKRYMHLPSALAPQREEDPGMPAYRPLREAARGISLEEIESILERAGRANQSRRPAWTGRRSPDTRIAGPLSPASRPKETAEEYLLVDGYNIIHAWPDLKALARESLDAARIQLLDILSGYQGIRRCNVLVVFDAYRVPGRREEMVPYHNIFEIYTREAQTADEYIERFAHAHRNRYHITVATSDGMQQLIVRSAGSALLSARELQAAVKAAGASMRAGYGELLTPVRNRLGEALTEGEKERMRQMGEATDAEPGKPVDRQM